MSILVGYVVRIVRFVGLHRACPDFLIAEGTEERHAEDTEGSGSLRIVEVTSDTLTVRLVVNVEVEKSSVKGEVMELKFEAMNS